MENVGEMSGEGEWSALNGIMFSSSDEAHAMAHWFGGHPSSLGEEERGVVYGVPSAYLPNHEPNADGVEFDENVYDCSDNSNIGYSYYVNQGSCFLENQNFSNFNNAALLVHYGSSLMGEQSNDLSNESLQKDVIGKAVASSMVNEVSGEVIGKTNAFPFQKSQPKRKIALKQEDETIEDRSNAIKPDNPRKKNRVSGMVHGGKKPQSKKSRRNATKFNSDDEETSNVDLNGQSSSSYSSEDDTNASQEMNGAAASSSSKESEPLNSSGKTRAKRGSATDPQSLYARQKRRERINERLKILQNLVPNGTKVDLSTMLEEAVQYVKFLQLQIKLLSSDDLWMYAPIAYNGMNIGLDLNISP
ncbi:hypothetical protein Sjap_017761 [Stephania japonica]|uniref:BHLH domain-containing protein n=1 Tax=Stephania japonica TaxID=461633 RepID=A0AAP0I6R6_9MAGN